MAYDKNNIFAKILRGEISSCKIYEDDVALVIMDAFPQVPGHCLIIAKAPSRNLLDAEDDSLTKLLPLTKRVAKAAMAAMKTGGVQILQFNEAPAGQTVFHLHIHIVPVNEGQKMGGHSSAPADQKDLTEQAEMIRQHL